MNSEVSSAPTRSKGRFVAALCCLIGPTALIIISLVFYAIVNFAFTTPDVVSCPSDTPISNNSLFEANCAPRTPIVKTVSNVALFIVGSVAVAIWLPGLIIGIVLLATRSHAKN